MSRESFTVAVLSGKGGVGKTTIALNLARALSRRGPVWLVDIDLFNRGATSMLWESERQIPLSIAQLILEAQGEEGGEINEEGLVSRLADRLAACSPELSYDENLALLPAARAREGREASYLLWRGLGEKGPAAQVFLRSLVRALQRSRPGCAVVLDGHGGLDDLSLAAAGVADTCYIVNEPDLVTFTGSVTLYREITEAYLDRPIEPRIEFIINRVPPGKSARRLEQEFGDILRTMSPAREPVAVYFPLERELFGVFGDDPFVSEVYTEYWFARKIDYLARKLLRQYGRSVRFGDRRDARTRTALRREPYKRGDLLLNAWLALALFALGAPFLLVATTYVESLVVLSPVAALLAGATLAWLRVQITHWRNSRVLRSGRRMKLRDSRSARLQDAAKQRAVGGSLRRVFIGVGVTGLAAALLIPNFLDAVQKARQKRTLADIRLLGTAWMSWLVDEVSAAAAGQQTYDVESLPELSLDQLEKLLEPLYIQEIPTVDAWGHPLEVRYSGDPLSQEVIMIRSPGRDGIYQGTVYENGTYPADDYDQDIVWADGYFVRLPTSSL